MGTDQLRVPLQISFLVTKSFSPGKKSTCVAVVEVSKFTLSRSKYSQKQQQQEQRGFCSLGMRPPRSARKEQRGAAHLRRRHLQALELRPTRWPLYSQKPLILAWNAPTEDCAPRHGVRFELDLFQIVASPNEAFFRQNLTIFYKDRLGLYPYFEEDKSPVNGGLPQVASLRRHLDKMPDVVEKYIREKNAIGLAVIDWEEWRPLWIRNWDTKDIYRKHSKDLVRQKNPTWPEEQEDFGELTGRCPDVEVSRNEQLKWLWEESTALFPSVYMATVLKSSRSGQQFVRNRVKEGMRLALSGEKLARPVFVYARPTYINSLEPLTETDLVSTIGESVALGAAGIILWGDVAYASSKTSCSELKAYLQDPLSKYLLNVSRAAELCSQELCGSNGRCLRRNPDADVYLHLSPLTHTITRNQNGRLTVTGELDEAEKSRFEMDFQCQCYSGFQGETWFNAEMMACFTPDALPDFRFVPAQ
ncbi:hypothetical protein WMY93_011661 [Mugilogobius chulae]|uniref:Hyaluronidase n=1 Tax=Mugilogobius chulae TaxID=88201 RepID=A0AAW0P4L6_9GOBI